MSRAQKVQDVLDLLDGRVRERQYITWPLFACYGMSCIGFLYGVLRMCYALYLSFFKPESFWTELKMIGYMILLSLVVIVNRLFSDLILFEKNKVRRGR